MLYLRVRAPFGVFRTFTAGSFRPTAPFVTHSAAYGLLLNLAGIESRLDDGESVATVTQPDLPRFQMALGALAFPEPQSLFQQLHNYSVGASEKVDDPDFPGQKITKEQAGMRRSKGSKYNIQPVRREFLSGIDACIAVRGNDGLEGEVRAGASPDGASGQRYGVPFLGDNAFLVDRLDLLKAPPKAHWFKKLGPEEEGVREGLCRLTVWVDRVDTSKTVAPLFYPESTITTEIPETSWVAMGPPA